MLSTKLKPGHLSPVAAGFGPSAYDLLGLLHRQALGMGLGLGMAGNPDTPHPATGPGAFTVPPSSNSLISSQQPSNTSTSSLSPSSPHPSTSPPSSLSSTHDRSFSFSSPHASPYGYVLATAYGGAHGHRPFSPASSGAGSGLASLQKLCSSDSSAFKVRYNK